jgi:hypothetical protein
VDVLLWAEGSESRAVKRGPGPTESDDSYIGSRRGMVGYRQFGRHFKASYTRNWLPLLDVKIVIATIASALRNGETDEHHFEEDFRIGLLLLFRYSSSLWSYPQFGDAHAVPIHSIVGAA